MITRKPIRAESRPIPPSSADSLMEREVEVDIDLERVIWDPDYRRDVLDELNRRKRSAGNRAPTERRPR